MSSLVAGYASAFAALREQSPRGEAVTEDGLVADVQLIALARESHADAFELLYGQYKSRIYTFLVRMVDVDTADDLAQDVFTKAYKALPSFPREQRILPWLYRVANNAAIDVLRRRRRLTWLRLGAVAETAEEPQAAEGHERVPERHAIEAILRRLPAENASALLLHALEGYSYREIAEIQGCTMTAVRSRIARARASFRDAYEATEGARRSSW